MSVLVNMVSVHNRIYYYLSVKWIKRNVKSNDCIFVFNLKFQIINKYKNMNKIYAYDNRVQLFHEKPNPIIWFDRRQLFMHNLCMNLKIVLKCVYYRIKLKSNWYWLDWNWNMATLLMKYWFLSALKFETDPKRKGINAIVEMCGRTFSFIKMIKCCTCKYTFKYWKMWT